MFKFLLLMIFFASNLSSASSVDRIPIEDMEQKSKYIILGAVVNIQSTAAQDEVTIEVRQLIKGPKLSNKTVIFWLNSKGGLKDFDPQLQKGDSVVAFLNEENGKFKKAYWGSVAVFTKSNFL